MVNYRQSEKKNSKVFVQLMINHCFVFRMDCFSSGPSIEQDMVSRRRILSRSRDDLHLENFPEEEDDVWHMKEKLYKVSTTCNPLESIAIEHRQRTMRSGNLPLCCHFFAIIYFLFISGFYFLWGGFIPLVLRHALSIKAAIKSFQVVK